MSTAEDAHQTWTRARHLLGTLCLEERCAPFAAALLRLMGKTAQLDAAVRSAASAQAGGRAQQPQPANAVDRELIALLGARMADGSLQDLITPKVR